MAGRTSCLNIYDDDDDDDVDDDGVNSDRGKRVRVLFDSGSQKTFVSAKAVNRLGPERSEELGIKTFGRKEPDLAERRVFKFSLSSIFDSSPVEVEAFEVNDISSHVERIKHNFAHLSNILFSDASRNQEILEIDILCGSNFLWSFQDGECIRGGPGEPTGIQTSLGWVLSGPLKGRQSIFLTLQMLIFALKISPLGNRKQN